ncbi:hypothetical protein LWI29_013722 [Acer saccharum]|uniref:Uncharacterized protein n=1 Tax=Acer saccharum TaxID=4024 RepID=A0AA39VXW0_ACESA|nr:hypothetical protein LWI29_013722 [Acer saccharum]
MQAAKQDYEIEKLNERDCEPFRWCCCDSGDKMLLGESVASIAKTFLESDAAVIEIKQPEAVAAGIRFLPRASNVVWDGLKEEWEQKLVKSTFPMSKKDMGMLTNYLFIFRV